MPNPPDISSRDKRELKKPEELANPSKSKNQRRGKSRKLEPQQKPPKPGPPAAASLKTRNGKNIQKMENADPGRTDKRSNPQTGRKQKMDNDPPNSPQANKRNNDPSAVSSNNKKEQAASRNSKIVLSEDAKRAAMSFCKAVLTASFEQRRSPELPKEGLQKQISFVSDLIATITGMDTAATDDIRSDRRNGVQKILQNVFAAFLSVWDPSATASGNRKGLEEEEEDRCSDEVSAFLECLLTLFTQKMTRVSSRSPRGRQQHRRQNRQRQKRRNKGQASKAKSDHRQPSPAVPDGSLTKTPSEASVSKIWAENVIKAFQVEKEIQPQEQRPLTKKKGTRDPAVDYSEHIRKTLQMYHQRSISPPSTNNPASNQATLDSSSILGRCIDDPIEESSYSTRLSSLRNDQECIKCGATVATTKRTKEMHEKEDIDEKKTLKSRPTFHFPKHEENFVKPSEKKRSEVRNRIVKRRAKNCIANISCSLNVLTEDPPSAASPTLSWGSQLTFKTGPNAEDLCRSTGLLTVKFRERGSRQKPKPSIPHRHSLKSLKRNSAKLNPRRSHHLTSESDSEDSYRPHSEDPRQSRHLSSVSDSDPVRPYLDPRGNHHSSNNQESPAPARAISQNSVRIMTPVPKDSLPDDPNNQQHRTTSPPQHVPNSFPQMKEATKPADQTSPSKQQLIQREQQQQQQPPLNPQLQSTIEAAYTSDENRIIEVFEVFEVVEVVENVEVGLSKSPKSHGSRTNNPRQPEQQSNKSRMEPSSKSNLEAAIIGPSKKRGTMIAYSSSLRSPGPSNFPSSTTAPRSSRLHPSAGSAKQRKKAQSVKDLVDFFENQA